MNRNKIASKVASRYLVASINTPLIEEMFRNTFTEIPSEDRNFVCRKLQEKLTSEPNPTQFIVERIAFEVTGVNPSLISIDVTNLFSDVGSHLLTELRNRI